MKIKRIEHVGVVVKNTEASRKLWEGCFGIPLGGTEENDKRKRIAFIDPEATENCLIELAELPE